MKNKVAWTIGIAAVLVGAVAASLFWLRAPAHRGLALLELLPPDADLYAVADLQSLQSNPAVKKLLADPPQLSREEEYERFVEASGFHYQTDLKQLAVAKWGPDWGGSARAIFDRPKVLRYLESQGANKSQERNQTIFTFGSTRPFRLVLLENDLVVFTIGDDDGRIRSILRRHFGEESDTAASQLQRSQELSHIPVGSELWVVGRLDRLLEQEGPEPRFGSFELSKKLLQGSQRLYASVESGPLSLSLQVEDRCEDAATAERIANLLQAMLGILQAMPPDSSKPPNEVLTAVLAGMHVEQVQQSVFVRWHPDRNLLSLLERRSP